MFIYTDQIKTNMFAFLPETFKEAFISNHVLSNYHYNSAKPTFVVAAYWYEKKQGKLIASFGWVWVRLTASYLKSEGFVSTNDFTYEDALRYAADTENTSVTFRAITKFGHSKPFRLGAANYHPEFNELCDDNVLLNMLSAPSLTSPANTDGWYSLNSKLGA